MSRGGCVAIIPARGGSTGLPRKNLRLLAGKPLIAYAIEAALSSKFIGRVVVSTENQEIAQVASQYGAEVPFLRPVELARDNSPEWLVWQHAIRTLETADHSRRIELFVCIPPTSPLRSVGDVDACIQSLRDGDADIVITVKPAERSPYFNMVVLDQAGYARLLIPSDGAIYRRQEAPPVFDMTTVAYAARPEFVLKARSMFEGRVKAVVVPPERAVDIDTEMDLRFAEFILNYRRIGSV